MQSQTDKSVLLQNGTQIMLPSRARLNYKPSGSKQGAWSAKKNDANQWLQVDLGASYTKVTRVASQRRLGADQWVKTYRLQYSDGVNLQDYREQGQTVNKVNLFKVAKRSFTISHALGPVQTSDFTCAEPNFGIKNM